MTDLKTVSTRRPGAEAAPDEPQRHTVLCVDDQESNRYLRGRVLRAAGFDVIEASDGASALSQAFAHQPSLVVLDIRLPDMSGFEVCARLKSDPRTRATPILHVSAAGRMEDDLPEALENQSDGYLREPIDPQTLVATARALVRAREAERRQKQAEEEAQAAAAEATELNRTLVQASTDCIKFLDLDARLIFMSEGGRKRLEIDDFASVANTNWLDFWKGADREAAAAAVETAKGGGIGSFEGYCPAFKGTPKWWDVVVSPILGRNGRPERLLAVSRDITERKQGADEVRATLESIGDGFIALDADWRFVYVNQAAERLLGFSREEVLGRSHWEVFPLTLGTGLEREYRRAAAGEATDFENFYEPWNRWFHLRCFPRRGGGMSVYFQDITERKRTEDALRESERRYSALFANRINAIAHCRIITGEHGEPVDYEILQVNDAYETVTGIQRRDIEGKRATEAFPGIEHFSYDYIGNYGKVALEGVELSFEAFFESLRQWFSIYVYSPKRGEFVAIFTDISERKRAEQALRDSEERFRTLADNISQFAWMADAEGSISWYNRRWYEYTGTTFEEMQGWDWRKVHHPDYVQGVEERFRRSIAAGETWEDTFPLRGTDGRYRWFLSRALPIRDEAGRVVRWFGTNTDITQHLETQQQLREALARAEEGARLLDAVMEYLPLGITIADAPDVNIRRVSRYGRELLERTADELTDIPAEKHPDAWKIYHADGVTPATAGELPLTRATTQGEVVKAEEWIACTKSGVKVPILCTAAPILDGSGRIIGGVIGWQDITHLKSAQRALEASESRLARTQEVSLVMSLHVGLNGRWLKVPPTFVRFLGYENENELLGRHFGDNTHPDDFPTDWMGVERLLNGEIKSFEVEKRFIRKDGSVTWGYLNCSIVTDEEGKPVHLLKYVRDITAQKEAEEELRRSEERERTRAAELESVMDALRQSEAKFRALFRSLVEGVVFLNADGVIEEANDAALRTHGDDISAMTDRSPDTARRIVRPDGTALRPEEHPAVAALRKGEAVRDVEMGVAAPDGKICWRVVNAQPVYDERGNKLGAVASFFDITGRKEAEEAARESRARLEAALASMTDAVFLSDSEGRFIDFNDAFAAFHRFRNKEECARAFAEYPEILDVYFPDGTLAPVDMWAVPRALRGETAASVEYTLRRKDTGETWTGSYSFSPIRDEDGVIAGAVVVARDITDRKRAEEALRASREQLRERVEELETVMDVAPVAIWVAHDPACENITGNRMANQLYEAVPEENVSGNVTRVRQFFHNGRELRAEELPMQVAARLGKDVRDAELEVGLPSGARHVMIGQASPLRDSDGRVRGCVGAFVDITERKRTEERLRQAQKLESVGLLAGGIAHDFNNLLTGILGNASMVVEEVGPGPAARIAEVMKSAERAAHLTRQLLAYSGKGRFVVRDVDVSQAVNESADLVQFSIPKSVELSITVQRRLPAVQMDPSQLQQILMNLVINAGEAIGEGTPGKITVATSMTDIEDRFVDAIGGEVQPGRYVCIAVTDTGSGIDEDKRSRIFDPFFTTKFTGRGLGLAAVAGIVRSQKGAVLLESVPGRGSTFRVLLPAAHSSATGPEAEPAADGRATILVVDDEPTVRDFIAAVFRRQDYRVLTASDGKDAESICEREQSDPDLAIVDIVMPVMGANEFLPLLRARHPGTRILLTSGYTESEARRLCAAYPGAAFIQKPYTARQITQAVSALLEAPRPGGRHN